MGKEAPERMTRHRGRPGTVVPHLAEVRISLASASCQVPACLHRRLRLLALRFARPTAVRYFAAFAIHVSASAPTMSSKFPIVRLGSIRCRPH